MRKLTPRKTAPVLVAIAALLAIAAVACAPDDEATPVPANDTAAAGQKASESSQVASDRISKPSDAAAIQGIAIGEYYPGMPTGPLTHLSCYGETKPAVFPTEPGIGDGTDGYGGVATDVLVPQTPASPDEEARLEEDARIQAEADKLDELIIGPEEVMSDVVCVNGDISTGMIVDPDNLDSMPPDYVDEQGGFTMCIGEGVTSEPVEVGSVLVPADVVAAGPAGTVVPVSVATEVSAEQVEPIDPKSELFAPCAVLGGEPVEPIEILPVPAVK